MEKGHDRNQDVGEQSHGVTLQAVGLTILRGGPLDSGVFPGMIGKPLI